MNESDIEEESQLAEYTDSHFTRQMNQSIIEQFRDSEQKRTRNTSSHSSSSSSDGDIESAKYRRFTYKDVSQLFDQYNSESNVLDIFITYLNGQKNLYIYASKFIQYKLHLFMIPIIMLLSSSTLIAPFIMGYKWSGIIISTMNALVLFLFILCNYLKFESTCNSFILLGSQYSSIHASLTLGNSHYMTEEKKARYDEVVSEKIMEFERKISEIRESTNIPSEIKLIFPIISHINIFSFIKHIETHKRNLIIQYKKILNEVYYIKRNNNEGERNKTRCVYLLNKKETIENEIIQYKNVHSEIENLFVKEIKKAETYKWYWLYIIIVGIRPPEYDTNSILYKHLAL